jgi:hypothetical protein
LNDQDLMTKNRRKYHDFNKDSHCRRFGWRFGTWGDNRISGVP